MNRHVISLLALLTAVSTAAVVPFETAADLSDYSITSFTGTLSQAAGIGAAASGGLRYQGPNTSAERGAVARKSASVTQNDGIWTTSILIQASEMDNADPTNDKAEIRIGFSATDTISATKPWEYFHKLNDGISLKFAAEHKPADSKLRNLTCELTNRFVSDVNSDTQSLNSSVNFDDWLKLTLTLVRSGSGGFSASYTLESLGAAGDSAPVPLLSSAPRLLSNATLAAAGTVHAGFAAKLEKSRVTSVYLDDHSVSFEAAAPETPAALAASSVAAQAFTAEWQAAATGVPAASYLLEISTAADNFAPGTFIAGNGATGQAAGISATSLSQAVSGLLAETNYVYRVRAVNTVGTSAPSNTIAVQTLSLTQNAPPTLDAIANFGPLSLTQTSLVIPLAGVTAGGESSQTVTVTASSDNTAVASPSVSYSSPSETGTLTLALGGIEGSATITVTADDGQAADHSVSRIFTVTLRNPPAVLGFETAADLDELTISTSTALTHDWFAGAGSGDPASDGVVVSSGSVVSGDRGFAAWRDQGHPLAGSSLLRTSLLVNPAQIDDSTTTDEAKLELRVGFTPTLNLGGAKPAEFLNKTNPAISAVLKVEHKPSDVGKFRKIEASIGNGDAEGGGKIAVLNCPAVNNWLKLTLTLVPTGGGNFNASYLLEDLGLLGTDAPVVVVQSGPHAVTNPAMGSATDLYAAYAGKLDKQLTYLRLDEHRSVALNDPPSQPQASAATMVTASSFRANWQPAGEVYPTGWLLEVVPNGSPFTAGNFISATGESGQTGGIVISDTLARSFRVSGLSSATAYRWRVTGTNLNGQSPASGEIAVTTLAAGVNAPPTLAIIANPAPVAIDAAQQSVTLSGITSGGEDGQTLTVTATSSNPDLIPTPAVNYTSPAETGTITYSPAPGTVGNAVITVTVSDGGANNPTVSRTFTIRVVNPDPVIHFENPADLADVGVSNFSSSLTHAPTGGAAGSGGIAYQGTVAGVDRVGVVVRPTAFDASSASYFLTSLDFNAAEVLNVTSGKDKGELRLGFMGNATPNALKPQDTVNKTHPSIGVKFKVEEDLSSSDKHRNLEAELFWSVVAGSESKDGKLTLNNLTSADHWFRVTFQAVRTGASQYHLSYVVDDMGADGSTFVARVMESSPIAVTNAAFFGDTSVFSAFSLSDEKSGPGSVLRADRFESIVNTTAPDAPAVTDIFDIGQSGFSVGWNPAVLGNSPQGYVVEVVAAGQPFVAGNFYRQDGTPGQATGFRVEDAWAFDAAISGLQRLKSYRVRVRAYGESPDEEQSLALGSLTATTIYGPGLEYEDWRTATFGANAVNDSIAGKTADPDHDGVSNMLEYALGLDPLLADSHLLPKADLSGDYLTLVYKRRHNVTGIYYEPQASSDLSDWAGEFDLDGPLEFVSGPDAEGMETVVVEDFYEIGVFPRRFLQVKVGGN